MTDTVQLFGVFVAAAIGAAGLFVVANEMHWCAYGRATLFWFAMYQWFFAVTRLVATYDVITRDSQVLLNILGSAAFLTLMLNLIVIHWMWHRTEISKKGENNGSITHSAHG